MDDSIYQEPQARPQLGSKKFKNHRNFGKPPLYTHMLGFAEVSRNFFCGTSKLRSCFGPLYVKKTKTELHFRKANRGLLVRGSGETPGGALNGTYRGQSPLVLSFGLARLVCGCAWNSTYPRAAATCFWDSCWAVWCIIGTRSRCLISERPRYPAYFRTAHPPPRRTVSVRGGRGLLRDQVSYYTKAEHYKAERPRTSQKHYSPIGSPTLL